MDDLKGKTVVISGGARGMGADEARLFVDYGANVCIGDVLDSEGQALADELGDQCLFQRLDVREESEWQQTIARAEETFGPVSVLVNNAGIARMGLIEGLSTAEYKDVIDVNQLGVFLGMREVIGSMKRAGGGSIVNISSVDGLIGMPGLVGYVASKFAVRGMTKVAALELGAFNIRVNSVHPGGVNTPMLGGGANGEPPGGGLMSSLPLGRIARPREVANLVAWLASEASSYCTGSEFTVDGGLTAGIVMGGRRD